MEIQSGKPYIRRNKKISWQPCKADAVLMMLTAKNISDDQLRSLIEQSALNHRKSQEIIFRMFYGKMMAVSRRYTRNDDQAKDILQDAFIKVFGNISRYSFDGSFEGWVRRIVVNTAIDFTRKAKNDYLLMNDAQTLENMDEQWAAEEVEEDSPEAVLNVNDVIAAMQKLSNAYRTVFNLYVFESYSHQDIADALGITVGTSKSNLAKARMNLKKILSKELDQKNGASIK